MRLPTEDQVREIVRRVLASPEVAAAAAAVAPASGPAAAPTSAAAPAPAIAGGPAPVALGADHGGFALKQKIAAHLRAAGTEVVDCGTGSTEAVDYPDYALAVGELVATGRARAGIVVDGAGIGSCMVANKVPGVRASLCYDLSSARNAREHNHANVLTLGAGLVGEALALQIVDAWLATPWGGDRHARRVAKIMTIEQRFLREPGSVPR